MPKLTNKHNQDIDSVAAEPENSAPNADKVAEDQERKIPVGASLFWEIPGDIPGANRRCVPMPAEADVPKASVVPVDQLSTTNTSDLNRADYSPDVSAYRKNRGNETDSAVILSLTDTSQSRPTDTTADSVGPKDTTSDNTTDSASNALASQPDLNKLQLSSMMQESSASPDASGQPLPVTVAPSVNTNNQEAAHTPSLPGENAAPSAQSVPPMMPFADKDPLSNSADSGVMAQSAHEPDLPENPDVVNPGAAEDSQPVATQALDKIPTAPLADRTGMEDRKRYKMLPKEHPEYPPAVKYTDTRSIEKTRKNYAIPALLALLLLLLLGGSGYNYFFENNEHQEVVINQPESQAPPVVETPVPVVAQADSEANTQVKVIEISVGKLDKFALSGIRMLTHVVVKGDTLWDIAETYHNNPWRYPELAERSKIHNPDLIYPGDLIEIHIKVVEQEPT